MSETKSSNDSALWYFVIMMPMWIVFIVVIANDNGDELLTDEQKLAKQKEFEIKKQQDELKSQQDAEWWGSKINYIFVEKPPVITFSVGIGLLLGLVFFTKSRQGRYWLEQLHYDEFLGFFNSRSMFILMIGVLYLMWVTGFGLFSNDAIPIIQEVGQDG